MNGLNYWDRLQTLRLYSVQRRRERYIILYVFKILHGLVPNCGLLFQENSRTGIRAVVPMVKSTLPSHIRKLRSNSFTHVAPLLYNLLPTCMRRMYIEKDPLSVFKRELDSVLSCVPDEPTIPGLIRNVKSNSLVHQMTSYIIWNILFDSFDSFILYPCTAHCICQTTRLENILNIEHWTLIMVVC